ncbi:MAG: UPF0489 family protein [Candidatus Gracilibacteria bacterium]|nr:UPF0489 family protein [Candidatus Gracilibacteria bacterium]
MLYEKENIIMERVGNNAFVWEERTQKYGKSPILTIPSLIEGDISLVQIGENIVFEEIENGKLRSCVGLKNFVQIYSSIPPITIFDNHNHALYFWIDAVRRGIIQPGFELIHIDEHSDLWENENDFDLEKALENEEYSWEFTNLFCNVGNYIQPALRSGLIGKMIRIENETEIEEYMDYSPSGNTVLNLDLDIFAPELDFIREEKKMQLIRNLLQKVDCVTIATSPYFIDQGIAIRKLQNIVKK